MPAKRYIFSFFAILLASFALYIYAIAQPHPKKPFATDICSAWPDWDYGDCCVVHDQIYWDGGSRDKRLQADIDLKHCVADKNSAFMGQVMYMGVRVGGHPWVPAPWRWNFGESYLKDIKKY